MHFVQVKDAGGSLRYSMLCEENYKGHEVQMDNSLVPSLQEAMRLLKKHMKNRLRADSASTGIRGVS